jgi:hypothetical protein
MIPDDRMRNEFTRRVIAVATSYKGVYHTKPHSDKNNDSRIVITQTPRGKSKPFEPIAEGYNFFASSSVNADISKLNTLKEKHKDIWRASMNFEDFFGKLKINYL